MTENPDFTIKVLHVASELAPLKKTGGLGDIAAALPKALRALGADARAVLPAWSGVLDEASERGYLRKKSLGRLSVALNYRPYSARVWKVVCEGVPVYILEQPELFGADNIYPDGIGADAALPFIFLSLAALELPETVGWKPQFMHAHDWQAAALPAALRWHKYYAPRSNSDYDTIFTIHNIAHQGIFEHSGLEGWGFSSEAFNAANSGSMEFYGHLSLMKGALTSCEAITTVSPRYSLEIQTPDYGFGLDGVIRDCNRKLGGILNGIDRDIWNPANDMLIAKNYDADNLSGKEACRSALLKRLCWQDDGRPLLAFIGRLAEQKGVDILLEALRTLTEDARLIVLGSGSAYYNNRLEHMERDMPDALYNFNGFSEELAHMVYAGSDIFLMPSLFEPCGLSQLIACAYGTVPVARATGGLADTVLDVEESRDGNGFLFCDYSADALLGAVKRARRAWGERDAWQEIMRSAMKKDFSWEASARRYIELYNDILTS